MSNLALYCIFELVFTPGLVIGLSVALAISSCCCVALAVLAVSLYRQLRNKEEKSPEPADDYYRNSVRDCYADNYYDSIK